ncbi:hypothetical protein KAX97_05645 [candidate division WOR-3 bacterium]|jgi:hypothetical protein|nr:hypothetical protein [candidate division WOR-3 bacterium]
MNATIITNPSNNGIETIIGKRLSPSELSISDAGMERIIGIISPIIPKIISHFRDSFSIKKLIIANKTTIRKI